MAENLPKRQIAGDAKWLSTIARLNRRGGHGDISNEVVIGDDWKEAIAKLLWALSQLQRGCQNPVLGLRAQCWAPEIGETFSGLNPLIPSNETNELLKPNHTYYVRTRRGTAITLWLPDATDSDGEVIEVKDADGSADTKNITIKTTKGQTIDGASTFTISASYGSAQIRSNGQQWYTVARKNASEGLSGLEVTQTTASTADNVLYRTDRPSSDNRVAQTTGITCSDSNDLSGIGTLASGAHTVTQATDETVGRTASFAVGSDTFVETEAVYYDSGTGTRTIFSFTPIANGDYEVEVVLIGEVTTAATDLSPAVGDRVHCRLYGSFKVAAGTVTELGADTQVYFKSSASLAAAAIALSTPMAATTIQLQAASVDDEVIRWTAYTTIKRLST